MDRDGVSLRSARHPTSLWWWIRGWFRRGVRESALETVWLDPEKIRVNRGGLKIAGRKSSEIDSQE